MKIYHSNRLTKIDNNDRINVNLYIVVKDGINKKESGVFAMKTKFSKKLLALLLGVFMVVAMIPAIAIGTNAADLDLTLCTGTLQEGDKVVIATPDKSKGVTGWNGNKDATLSTDQSTWVQYTVGISGSGYTFYDEGENTYIASPGSSNQFKYGAAGVITVQSDGQIVCNSRYLQINSSYVRFYTSISNSYTGMYVYIVNESGDTGCEHANTEPIAEVPATCTETGMTAGTKCSDCGEVIEEPQEIPALGHNFVNDVCTRCDAPKPTLPTNGFSLLTDVSYLQAGYSIIIVNTENGVALAGQNTSNRAQEAVVISNKFIALDGLSDNVQIITLEAGAVSGTYAFNVGTEGYLYAASSSGNQLKSKTTLDANGSWAITIDGSGNATITAQGTNSRNWLRYNLSSSLFSCYGPTSTQKDIQIYYLPVVACDHVWVDGTVINEGDCTTDRVVAQVCDKCGEPGENKTITAPGHIDVEPADSKCDKCGINLCENHVWVDGEVIIEGDCVTDRVVAQVCDNCGEVGENKTITAPGHSEIPVAGKPASCTETGLTDGTHCTVCDKDIVIQEVIPMLPHDMQNGACTVCGLTGQTYNKVTSDLNDFTGTYLIVYEAGSLAFNGSLDDLDDASNGIDVVIDEGSIAGDFLAYTFTVTKTPEGAYTIYSASGYYIGQTSDANGLMTSTETAYESTISIDADGNAVIADASGAQLRFNSASNQMRFRYYKTTSAAAQKAVTLYKLDGGAAPTLNTFGITLNKGVTVRVKLTTATDLWLKANPGAKVVFNDGTRDIATLDYVNDANHVYEIDLTPGQIGSTITVNLGEMSADVSVSKYIEKAKAAFADNTALVALLDAIDIYGKAAAKVQQDLATPDFTGVNDYVLDDENGVFGGFANVVLGEYATIGLKINAQENYTYVATLGSLSTGVKNLENDLTDGVLLIENLRPANFADVITVTIMNGDEEVAKITFSFNSYLKLAYSTEADALNLNIITATYNYGVAAKAYLNASAL